MYAACLSIESMRQVVPQDCTPIILAALVIYLHCSEMIMGYSVEKRCSEQLEVCSLVWGQANYTQVSLLALFIQMIFSEKIIGYSVQKCLKV